RLALGLGPGIHFYFVDACRNASPSDFEPVHLGVKAIHSERGAGCSQELVSCLPGSIASASSEFFRALHKFLKDASGQLSSRTLSDAYDSVSEQLNRPLDIGMQCRNEPFLPFDGSREEAEAFRKRLSWVPLNSGKVPTLGVVDEVKRPPVELLTVYDRAIFFGETNSQLPLYIKKAVELRKKKWTRIDVFSLRDFKENGRPDAHPSQLLEERDRAEEELVRLLGRYCEDFFLYRYDYEGAYGSLWKHSSGVRRVHISPRIPKLDIRASPATDYAEVPGTPNDKVQYLFERAEYLIRTTKPIASRAVALRSQATAAEALRFEVSAHLSRIERVLGDVSPASLFLRCRSTLGPRAERLSLAAEQAVAALKRGALPSSREQAALQLSLSLGRSSQVCAPGKVGEGEIPAWLRTTWQRFTQSFAASMDAIGCLERAKDDDASSPSYQPVATGFLIRDDVVLTTRYAVDALTFGGMQLEPGMARFDVDLYGDAPRRWQPVALLKVIAVHETLDVALLQSEPFSRFSTVEPLSLAGIPPTDSAAVCTIGHPGTTYDHADLVNVVFGCVGEAKQSSLAEILSADALSIYHDCSTLMGSLGSPVIDVETAAVVGVQSRGSFLTRNIAVSTAALENWLKQCLD
ncbi:MAG: serine protease, partial [Myxococcota bacterium]